MKAPCTRFGQTKMVDVNVHLNGKQLQEVFEWDEDYWIFRPEEWYGLMSEGLKYKRVRVITEEDWKKGTPCNDN